MKKRSKILEAANEVEAFLGGRNTAPLTLYVPDKDGGLVRHSVANIEEYRALCCASSGRLASGLAPPAKVIFPTP